MVSYLSPFKHYLLIIRLMTLFKSSLIFRVFSDDFIVLNPLHVTIDEKEVLYRLRVGFAPITVSLQHFDLKKTL